MQNKGDISNMSTKLYNGLKVTDPQLFLIELASYRERLSNEYSDEPLARFIAREFFKSIVSFELNTSIKLTNTFIKEIDQQFSSNKYIAYTKMYDLQLNYFPKNNLIIPYFENIQRYYDLLEFDSVIDYSFWDNTDQPEDIDDDEWATRASDWNDVTMLSNFDYSNSIGYKNVVPIEVFNERIDTFHINDTYGRIAYDEFFKFYQNKIKMDIVNTHGSVDEKAFYKEATKSASAILKHHAKIKIMEKNLMDKHYPPKTIEKFIKNELPNVYKYKKTGDQ